MRQARYKAALEQSLISTYTGISPETRKAEVDAIGAEIAAYYGRKAESGEKIKAMVNSGITSFFTRLLDARKRAYDHDYEFNEETAKFMTSWVKPTTKTVVGFVTEEAVTDLAVGMFISRIARSSRVADDVAEAARKQADADADAVEAATSAVAKRADPDSPSVVEVSDLKNLRGGAPVNAAQALRGWVVDKVTDANLIKLTDWKNGGLPILVAVRSRADETIEWMRTHLGMTPKPVSMKPKNVDELDEAFLGYRRGVGYGDGPLGKGAGDRGSVVLAEPLPPEEIRQRILNAPEELRYAIADRYHTRWEEWYGKKSVPFKPEPPADPLPWEQIMPSDTTLHPDSYVWELKFHWARRAQVGDGVSVRDGRVGVLPVPKRGSVPDPSINSDVSEIYEGAGMEYRKLELRQVTDPPDNGHFGERPREYYEVWLEDEVGALRRVAGDIDTVICADLAGYKLRRAPRLKDLALNRGIFAYGNMVARLLQHVMKAQHPWSSSLIPDKMRAKYLDAHRWHPTDLNKRGEPLLCYFNGERRVGWFHPEKNIDPENPLASLMFLDGGPMSVDDVVRSQWTDRNKLARPEDQVPKIINTAANAVRRSLIENDYANKTTLLATCVVSATRTSGATLYRLSETQDLEKRHPDGTWSKTFPETECGPDGIVLVPETVLSEVVVAGVLRLPIIEELLGENWRDLFRIGDDILIAPGTPTEEQHTISGHGSLILSRPLKYSHPAGTRVALLPPRPTAGIAVTGQPLIWLRADAGVERQGTSVLTWRDQAGRNLFVNPEGGRDGLPFWIEGSDLAMPAIQFQGDEWISVGMEQTLTNATIFTLSRFNTETSSGYDYLYALGTPGVPGSMMTLGRRGDDLFHYDGRIAYQPDTVVPGNAWQVFTQVYGEGDPTRHQVFLNGQRVLNTLTASPYNVDASKMFLGNYVEGNNFFIGDIVEWLVYDRVLTANERLQVEDYLKRRGGIYQPAQTLVLSIRPSTVAVQRWVLSWPAVAGQVFQLEHSTTLDPGSWTPERTITAQGTGTLEIELTPANVSGVFYRLQSAGVVPEDGGEQRRTFGNNGNLWTVSGTGPTRIEAENFDEGGHGVAYHDANAQNAGGAYRAEAVDIYATGEFGGGHTVGSIAADEWLAYTIRVEQAGAYRLRARTARGQSGNGTLRFLFNGVDKTGNLVIPATGNWDSYATVESKAFELAAGTQILLAHMVSAGFNLNWIEIVPDVPVVQTTFGNNGHPWSVSRTAATRIEAENFDEGGQGVAYHDTNPQNVYGAYRAEGVDIGTTTDGGGGPTLRVSAGEWLEYTIRVEQAGEYRLRARTSRGSSGSRAVRFLFDGVDKTGSMVVPPTGNWESYTTVESLPFELPAGVQILRADITSGDFNLNWIEIAP